MKLERPLVVFDLETTGVDTSKDRIVEIAMIKLFPDGTKQEKEVVLNPTIPIPQGASDVHGFTDEAVKDKPTFKQLSKGIHDFIQDCDLVTFNGNKFDIPILYAEFERSGIEWIYNNHRFIDASVIFRRQERRTLEAALMFYCGKELEGAHGAMADTVATLNVLQAQLERYEEVPKDFNELHFFCNYDKEIADLNGCFELNSDGDFVLTFGKWKGYLAKDCKSYLQWMISSDFGNDTKLICREILGI